MLSNYILNQQKIILIKDELGIEPKGQNIVNLWLHDGKGPGVVVQSVKSFEEQGPYLFTRISRLDRVKNPSEIFKFVHRCKRNKAVQYLFLWATLKNISNNFLVPYLEHQSELIITLEDERHLTILVKKSGGSVSNKRYQYQLQEGTFSAKEIKQSEAKTAPAVEPAPLDPASLGTFKIGDLNKEEQQAKEALTLPFEFFKTTPDGGRVLYHPDAQDDLDEEDPDDDLLI